MRERWQEELEPYETPRLDRIGVWDAKVFQQSVPIGAPKVFTDIEDFFDSEEFWK